jgi:hypothetical protein
MLLIFILCLLISVKNTFIIGYKGSDNFFISIKINTCKNML